MRLGPRARRAAPRLTRRAAVSAWARGRGAGGGGAYSLLCPQGLPLPPLGARARARSETRWSDKCYFPAQSRWARLDWRRRPGHVDPAAGQCAGPRRLPAPRPESSTASTRDGFPLPAGDHVRKGLFSGVSTAPGPTWQNPILQSFFLPGGLGLLFKMASKVSHVPRPEGGRCPKVQTPPPGPGERPSRDSGESQVCRPPGGCWVGQCHTDPPAADAGALGATRTCPRHRQGPSDPLT